MNSICLQIGILARLDCHSSVSRSLLQIETSTRSTHASSANSSATANISLGFRKIRRFGPNGLYSFFRLRFDLAVNYPKGLLRHVFAHLDHSDFYNIKGLTIIAQTQ
jgi:hypothetical protein